MMDTTTTSRWASTPVVCAGRLSWQVILVMAATETSMQIKQKPICMALCYQMIVHPGMIIVSCRLMLKTSAGDDELAHLVMEPNLEHWRLDISGCCIYDISVGGSAWATKDYFSPYSTTKDY
ncbi:uncharacterized protein LOC107305325 [Oryza brachyantha]|uniref:uncharacterized protein LOC107305325 n=1 Tax=Oryza brachyantha TaxID=4533 RepID=UPI0007761A27|nr:uncharacterized protein LOC107305325 [Oryza brachyantha]XP_040384660.1 uncharacterized protein LOC107305325 [Oryza brachyantha]